MKKVKIPSGLAWRIVNLSFGIRAEEKNLFDDLDHYNISKVFSKIFSQENKTFVNFSVDLRILLIYQYLRPEIITQFPIMLRMKSAVDTMGYFGDNIELSSKIQYQYHTF